MSVEINPMLTIGWRVNAADIPDFEQRYDECWEDLAPLLDYSPEDSIGCEDLCDEENQMYGDTFIVGITAPRHELPIDEFLRDMDARAVFARQVYEQVMRKLPKDGPYMISWEKVW